ncbi:MAG: hypothetical protein PHP25_02980 [Candidatus Moranbacteria bacterium]|nr:hypothetical protein [Candidatus Moranbacteria bacterium]
MINISQKQKGVCIVRRISLKSREGGILKKSVAFLVSLAFSLIIYCSVSTAAERPLALKWGKSQWGVSATYDRRENRTLVSLNVWKGEKYGGEKSSLIFPGFVEAKTVKNFFGPGQDAVVLIFREGSGGNMRYEVYKINPRVAKLVKIPGPSRDFPAGEIVPDKGGFLIFSGVRYSVAYFHDGCLAEKTPLATVVEKDVPAVFFSLRSDGEIETHPIDLPAKGVRVGKGQKLYFLRSDMSEPQEEIRCEGLAMELPPGEPCARLFPDGGKGFITIRIERKMVKIPLTVSN